MSDNRIVEVISIFFNLPKEVVADRIRRAPFTYSFYNIQKRHGGEREIASPSKTVRIIQKLIIKVFLQKYPVHECAYAYVKERNIKQHALLHVDKKYLLKLDLENFFNNLTFDDVYKFFSNEYSPQEAEALAQILCCAQLSSHERYVSIGAPSSPLLSNILMYEFDCKVSSICSQYDITYSRYADDLAFSTNTPHILRDLLLPEIKLLLKSQESNLSNLLLNKSKIFFTSKRRNRHLTGLVLSSTGQSVSIGREKKRLLRSQVHNYQLLSKEEKLTLEGRVAFLSSIDPIFAKQLKNKINRLKIT